MSAKSSLDNVLMEVESCSKAVLAACPGYGKSPCFSGVAFLRLLGVDARPLKLACLNGAKTLECTFCHGSK